MTDVQPIEQFGDNDKSRLMQQRVRQAVQRGMVEVLNVGYKGVYLFYPKHQRRIAVPEIGATITVPTEVAEWMLRTIRGKFQYVTPGQMPANYTPPPGFKLVPADESPIAPMDEKNLLVDPQEE